MSAGLEAFWPVTVLIHFSVVAATSFTSCLCRSAAGAARAALERRRAEG